MVRSDVYSQNHTQVEERTGVLQRSGQVDRRDPLNEIPEPARSCWRPRVNSVKHSGTEAMVTSPKLYRGQRHLLGCSDEKSCEPSDLDDWAAQRHRLRVSVRFIHKATRRSGSYFLWTRGQSPGPSQGLSCPPGCSRWGPAEAATVQKFHRGALTPTPPACCRWDELRTHHVVLCGG